MITVSTVLRDVVQLRIEIGRCTMLTLNMKDGRPLYEQVVDGIKEQVIKGMLKPGDQIPSIRQLAGMLTITPNTVSKAYQELERQNVIETVRGKGAFVAQMIEISVNEEKVVELKRELKKVCVDWHYTGKSKGQLLDEIEGIYKTFGGSEVND